VTAVETEAPAYNEALVAELITRRDKINADMADLKKELGYVNEELMEELKKAPDEAIDSDGKRASISRQTKFDYDWDAIKKVVGALKWKKIVKEVPDPGKLAQVAPELIGKYATEVPAKVPFVRVDKIRKEDS
jgi:hypothetical protein